jgi:hypothetical protein
MTVTRDAGTCDAEKGYHDPGRDSDLELSETVAAAVTVTVD